MEFEFEEKLTNFLNHFKNIKEIEELTQIKEVILKDSKLLDQIKKVQTMNKYDPSYLEEKHKLLMNPTYKRYLELEQELTFLTFELTSRLKSFIKETKNENH